MGSLFGEEDVPKKQLDAAKEHKKIAEKSLDKQKKLNQRMGRIGVT